jgi:hypothetical protein
MSSSDEIEFDPKLPAVDKPAEATASAPTAAIGDPVIAEISAAIASGKLDPAAAQQLLIDRVLAEQFPGVSDLEPLRAALAELLEGDPLLASLLRA